MGRESQKLLGVYHINPVRHPKTIGDVVSECLNHSVCNAVFSSAASSAGLPPDALRMARAAAFVKLNFNSDSEDTNYRITPPPGYRVCSVHINTQSVVPASGDRASLFSLVAKPHEVAIYTWTPIRGFGRGKAFYDGFVSVTFAAVHAPVLCSINGDRRYACRGATGVNKGLPACSAANL
jgi:hypothetical protein